MLLNEYIENIKNHCEIKLNSMSKFYVFDFDFPEIQSKSYSQFLYNLNQFKLYVDIYKNISNYKKLIGDL